MFHEYQLPHMHIRTHMYILHRCCCNPFCQTCSLAIIPKADSCCWRNSGQQLVTHSQQSYSHPQPTVLQPHILPNRSSMPKSVSHTAANTDLPCRPVYPFLFFTSSYCGPAPTSHFLACINTCLFVPQAFSNSFIRFIKLYMYMLSVQNNSYPFQKKTMFITTSILWDSWICFLHNIPLCWHHLCYLLCHALLHHNF